MRTLEWLETLWQDARFGGRMLRRQPAFTALAILTLALGIGGNSAIFSVVDGVLLKPLPFPDPERLVMLYETTGDFEEASLSYPNFLDWQRDSRSFEGMAAFRREDVNLTGGGLAEYARSEMVSADFFSVLGVRPILGRVFSAGDDQPEAAPVAIVSAGLWKRRFGGAPGVLGKTVTLNGTAFAVVGVLPEGFRLWSAADLYTTFGPWRAEMRNDRAQHPGIYAVARLKPGVSAEHAGEEMRTIAARLAATYPEADGGRGATVRPLKQDMVGDVRLTLVLLWAAVGFVLLIACANVANLLLARSAGRRRELLIRASLGAGRMRIVRQLLTESVLLGLLGGGLGLLLAAVAMKPLLAAVPDSLPRVHDVRLDGHVLWFTLAASLLTGLLFGLAPALFALRGELQASLQQAARTLAPGRHRLRSGLVVLEVAASLLLLVGAGLMIRTLHGLWQVRPGFDPANLLTMQVALSPEAVGDAARVRTAYGDLLGRVRGLPGVESAAVTALLPLSGADNELPFWAGEGTAPPMPEMPLALNYITSPGYLSAMRIPLLRGRYFTSEDDLRARPVVVIDETLARHYFAGRDPVGRELTLALLGKTEIVGVVGHVRHWGLDTDDTSKVRDQLYFPVAQVPDRFIKQAAAGLTLVLRTRSDPLAAATAVTAQVMGPGRDQPAHNVQSMQQILATSLARRRYTMLLLGIFALVALALAAVGIYGVIAYAVSLRTQEIGIRIALGAGRRDTLALVVGQGMAPALAGVGIGVLGGLSLTRFMSSLLFGVSPGDPATFAAVAVLLSLTALLACYLPARRALRVDPVVALRCE